jgi:orotidine-5'-phosphate decarboxylase
VDPLSGTAAARCGRGLFILARTSNPSGGEIQEFPRGRSAHPGRHMAERIADWGRGLVGECGNSAVEAR